MRKRLADHVWYSNASGKKRRSRVFQLTCQASQPHQLPIHDSSIGDFEPCEALDGGARTADATGIEPAHATLVGFVARHVRVTMQHGGATSRRATRRDVHEMKAHALTFEVERQRPGGMDVVVAKNNAERRAELLELDEHRGIAHVTKVPDFVGPLSRPGSLAG